MSAVDGFPAASGRVDSTELRKVLAGLVARDTTGTVRAGVFPRGTTAIVTARGDMKVDVAAFEGITVRNGGPILCANDGTVQVTIAAAPGANSRIDVIYFKQNENALGDANDNPIIDVAQGTASASPAKPAIPAGATELATILIPTGVSATNSVGVVITQTSKFTAAAGAPVLVRDNTDLAAWTPVNGSYAERIDNGILYKRVAGAWKAWEATQVAFTPTLTNVTLGTGGTNDATYDIVAGRYIVRGQIILGTGGSFGAGGVKFSPPVNQSPLVTPNQVMLAGGKVIDTGTAAYTLSLEVDSASTIAAQIINVAGTYAFPAAVTNAVPFAAGPTDRIVYEYTFVPA